MSDFFLSFFDPLLTSGDCEMAHLAFDFIHYFDLVESLNSDHICTFFADDVVRCVLVDSYHGFLFGFCFGRLVIGVLFRSR